jgi:hypothetical protein
MPERPITATLDSTFSALDELVRRDADAGAQEEAQERLALLLGHVQQMQRALRRLRAASAIAAALEPGGDAAAMWERTAGELRAQAPPGFRTPGRAIVAGHLDLLRLVAYTAASAAVADERCAAVRDHIVGFLSRAVGRPAARVSVARQRAAPDELRDDVEGAIERLASAGGRADAAGVCRELGWLLA